MPTGDTPHDRMIERSAERIPFNELPAEQALELVREWRAAAENNHPIDSLESTDRIAGFVKLTSGEVTGQVDRPGRDLPGSSDSRIVDEVLEGVKFVMRDGDTFDQERSRAFGSSLQRVADVCVVDAIRNVIETGKGHGRKEEIGELLEELCSDDCDFNRRGRAQQEVAWLLAGNTREGKYLDVSIEGLAVLAKRGQSGMAEAVFALAEVEQSSVTEWGAKAARTLDGLENQGIAYSEHMVQSARRQVAERAAA